MTGRWFEEFQPGDEIEHEAELIITQEDNEAFCRLTQNTQPLHLDAEAAKAAGFKDVLINGLYTFSASVGMSVPDLTEGTLVANLGYDDVQHPNPVYPGDKLRVHSTILSKRESGKGGRGIVFIEHEVYNQGDVLVCSYKRAAMVKMAPEQE